MSTLITIDLDALSANYRHCSEQLAPGLAAAVVKADAYSLGLEPIARTLHSAGCGHFFTATHGEGVKLRAVLPEAEIFVLEGVTDNAAALFLEHRLTPVLICPDQAECWAMQADALGTRLPAIIHLDTGMSRLGFGEAEIERLLQSPEILESFDLRFVMTHYACADDPDNPMNALQQQRFDVLRRRLPEAPTSIGNSAGALLGAERAGDLARLGISLFGGNPSAKTNSALRPVVRVQSQVLQIRQLTRDATVSYGATYTAKAGTRIATVGIGYADGYPWSLSNKGIAVIDGHRVPVIGRVTMDLIMLDVTALPEDSVNPGMLVDLIGPDISLEEVAELAGTVNYEILTGLGQRATREYLSE